MNDTIGQRISQCRKAAQLSQEALGEKLGVSRQAVSKWESDAVIPEIDKLIGLSRLFDVSVGWLLGVEKPAQPEEDPALSRIEVLLKDRQPKWQKLLLILTALCAAVSLSLSIYTLKKQQELPSTLEALYGQVQSANNSGLKSTFLQITPWEDWLGAELTFTMAPTAYNQGDTARLHATSGGQILETAECIYDQGFWTATLSLPAAGDYRFEFSLTGADGTGHREALYGGQPTDLEAQLAYRVSCGCESASIRPGYFTIYDLTLNVLLPPVLADRDPAPQWEQLDLVFFRNGVEFFRKDYRYAAPSGGLFYSSHGISAPVENLMADDKITVHIQARTESGPMLDQMLLAWQVLAEDSLHQIYRDPIGN